MPSARYSPGYSPELDGLRGAAILIVMVFHSDTPLLQGGFIGVDIFFVLSGFLITSLLVKEFDHCGSVSLRNFYARRVLRLAPALLTLLFLYCAASFLLLNATRAHSNYIDSAISLLYVSNWARAFSIHPPDFLGHTWSLSIEEQFYIAWPILLIALLRALPTRRSAVGVAVFIAFFVWMIRVYLHADGATPERLYNGLDTRADGLMMGSSLGIAFASGFFDRNSRKRVIAKILSLIAPASALGLLAFASCTGQAVWRAPYMYHFGFVAIEILTVVVLADLMINQDSVIGRLLRARSLVWIGSISYGLYLWHYPIYRAMFALDFGGLAVVTAGSAITFVVASLSYYLMEAPVLRLKESLIYSHDSGRPPRVRLK